MTFERYKKDIESLVARGGLLYIAMIIERYPEKKKPMKIDAGKEKLIGRFSDKYQAWYSEALACVTQLLPDRVDDLVSCYKAVKPRKEILWSNYTVWDYLQGTTVTRGYQKEKVVGPDAALPVFEQQLNIVKSMKARFESSLFDIRALVQADLFDNELDAAQELNKKGFFRAGGAVAGVVLEGHLRAICVQHKITLPKIATLGKLNELLKGADVLDVPTWRFIQHLIDLRNLCDHKMAKEPTKENIEELIAGVRKTTKTVF